MVTQSVVQDVFWLQQAVEQLKELWFSAYFASRGDDEYRYFVVIPLTQEFHERFDSAWRRLAKDAEVTLLLQTGEEGDAAAPVEW